jgi:hypothetical protein
VAEALAALDVEGPVAAISAGWQEREAETEELGEHVGRPVVNLELYRRAEDALQRDPELAAALRRRQDRLREIQELYRLRLDYTLEAARALMRRVEPMELVHEERRSAIRALRTLDGTHSRRVRAVHEEFEQTWRPGERESVAAHREAIARLIEETGAIAIAGGHVAVLLNRLRLFDVLSLFGERPVVAWSAGAMTLAERIVLFHDSPPQGRGNPEVLDIGLGACRRVLPLPDASHRLDLHDPVRVALFARRFRPQVCVALDAGSWIEVTEPHFAARRGTKRLSVRGRVTPAGRR